MERCETPASRSLSSSALGSAAIASLAPAAMAKALVCFPPSLDPMAHEDRLPHGVPGRPTVREAEVGGARTWALLSALLSTSNLWAAPAARGHSPGPHRSADKTLGAPRRSSALPGLRTHPNSSPEACASDQTRGSPSRRRAKKSARARERTVERTESWPCRRPSPTSSSRGASARASSRRRRTGSPARRRST